MKQTVLLSEKVLAGLQYRGGLDRPNNTVTSAEEGVWLVFKGTTGVMNVLPNGTILDFKRRLRIFTHILAGHFDDYTLERHPLPEPDDTEDAASDLGIANASAFAYDVAFVKDGEGWKVLQSDGKYAPASEYRNAYHTWVNWFIHGHSVVLRIPQFSRHAEYMKVVNDTLHAPKDEVWALYQKHIEERIEAKELYKVQQPFIQNDMGELVNAKAPRGPKFIVTNLTGEKIDMSTQEEGTTFGVYASGTFMFPITWLPGDKVVMEGWKALVESRLLRVGSPQ